MKTSLLLTAFAAHVVGCSGEAPATPSSSLGERVEATPWCHAGLTATDRTSISLDYQATGSFTRGNAFFGVGPLWFNVHRQDLHEQDAVRLVFLDLEDGRLQSSQTIDLTFAEPGRFTAPATAFETAIYRAQQVAIVINGTWLKDPISGNSNFTVSLAGDGGRTVRGCGVMG